MEIKVNDYVRTKWGCIAKLEGIHQGFYDFDNIIIDESSAVNEEIFVNIVEKISPRIIDLIEVGDYVNGYKVLFIDKDLKGTKNIKCIDNTEERQSFYDNDIKSVLTKETFEQMEYKIN